MKKGRQGCEAGNGHEQVENLDVVAAMVMLLVHCRLESCRFLGLR